MPDVTSMNLATSCWLSPRRRTLSKSRSLVSSARVSARGCCRLSSTSRYVPSKSSLAPPNSLATNCNNAREGVVSHDRVAGVRSALVAADHVRVLRQDIDDLALSLVAPLGADDDGCWHGGR